MNGRPGCGLVLGCVCKSGPTVYGWHSPDNHLGCSCNACIKYREAVAEAQRPQAVKKTARKANPANIQARIRWGVG